MARTLVNLGAQCEGAVNLCANTTPTEAAYGAQGEQGIVGAVGLAGTPGRNAFTTSLSPFSMPPVGSLAALQVLDNRSFSVGQKVYIAGVGYFDVAALTGITSMTVRNLGGTSTLPPGALIGSGLRVTSGAQPGPDTPANAPKRWAFLVHGEAMGEDGGPMDVQQGTGSAASGTGVVNHLQDLYNDDGVVIVSGSDDSAFQLPVGLWNLRIRVPSYYCRAFQVRLVSRASLTTGGEQILAIGNGYAGIDADGADPQRYASLDALVSVSNPALFFQVRIWQESWSFARVEPTRSRAKGIASDFDDGASVPVREMFTTIEIEEL
jgi:hypothetical protein